MKCVYFLVLVIICQIECTTLQAPKFLKLTLLDPLSFHLTWDSVSSDDSTDPVLGYKVKVWEYPTTHKEYTLELVDGVEKWVEMEVPNDNWGMEKPIKEKEIVTDKTNVLVKDLKFNTKYETAVRAYTKTTEGPMSDKMAVSIPK